MIEITLLGYFGQKTKKVSNVFCHSLLKLNQAITRQLDGILLSILSDTQTDSVTPGSVMILSTVSQYKLFVIFEKLQQVIA